MLYKKTIYIVSFISIIVFYSCRSTDNSQEVTSFNNSIALDASLEVVTQIKKIKQNKSTTITFEKGIYHFYPDKAFELYRYISNHDDQLTRTPFPLIGMKNVTIDGQGSTFIFHGIMIPFIIDGSSNITIKNLSIDWEMPFHYEGEIVANDPSNHTYDIRFTDENPYEIRNGELYFIKEYYQHTIGQSILFNPKTQAVAYNTEKYSTWYSIKKKIEQYNIDRIIYKYKTDKQEPLLATQGKENNLIAKHIKSGVVRIYNHGKDLPPVGLIMVGKGEKGENRSSPAFHITNTNGFTGINVNILHAGGMGLIAENSSDFILDNFNVIPSEGRMVSTTADATHFVGCRGNLIIRNCTFNNQLDDACNIHGAYKEVVDIINQNTLGVRSGHFQQKGFSIGFVGDTIALVRESESLQPYQILTITNIEVLNGRYALVTFNEKLKEKTESGDLLENLSAYPNVHIHNCNISKNRARGLLLGSKKQTVIENNYFNTQMIGILMPAHVDHWYEASIASNVIIRNNKFKDCAYGGVKGGCIKLTAEADIKERCFNNIKITNNTFDQFDSKILDVEKTNGLEFTGNEITNSGTYEPLNNSVAAIKIVDSENVIFDNNTFNGNAKVILETDNSLPNLKFK